MAEMNMECTRIRVADIEVEVRAAGSGKRTVLFLHPGDGLEGDNAALGMLSKSCRLIAPSHPGFGQSELPKHFRTIDDLAYFYLDFLESQNLSNVVLAGVSFGAWIAAEIAIKNTSRIAGLVLADAVGAKFGDRMTREIADIFSYPMYEHAQLLYEDSSRRQMSHGDLPEEVLLRLARNYESFALFGWSPTLLDPQLVRRLHRIKVPTQFLWGEKDRVVPVEYGRKFAAAIPGAGFEVIAGVGHYPHIENPQAFVAAVERFCGKLPG